MLAGAYFGPIGWFIGVPLFAVLYRITGDVANRALTKKNLPVDLGNYEETLLREIYVDVFTATAEGGKEEENETLVQ
jgi:hypothetical protein